jgi:hypothetical protein
MGTSQGIDQLGRDPHPLARVAHRPFEDIAHAQLAADVLHADGLALVGEARIAASIPGPSPLISVIARSSTPPAIPRWMPSASMASGRTEGQAMVTSDTELRRLTILEILVSSGWGAFGALLSFVGLAGRKPRRPTAPTLAGPLRGTNSRRNLGHSTAVPVRDRQIRSSTIPIDRHQRRCELPPRFPPSRLFGRLPSSIPARP